MNKGLEFLKTTDWDYKEVVSQQYAIKTCPHCNDDRRKFYMSYDGLWDCKICGEAGNLYQLRAKLTGLEDKIISTRQLFSDHKDLDLEDHKDYIENLWENNKALWYLKKRGFTKETITHFQLGLEDDWLMIPHFQNDKLWNYKMRNYIKKDFKRVTGQPSILFNIDSIESKKKKKLVIVESETDCMSAWQMGVKNVVGLTTGAGTFAPEWISFTVPFEEIYICLNSDVAGQKGALKIAEKLGISKCKNVILPTNDVNDFLKERPAEEFIELLKNAKRFPAKDIKHIGEFIKGLDDWLAQEGTLLGLELQYACVNKVLHGFKEEDLIVLSGDAGVGKTTICLNFVQHFAKNGYKTLIVLLEGKLPYFVMRMLSMEIGVATDDLNKTEHSEKFEKVKKTFVDYPIYFYSGAQGELEPKTLKEFIELAVKLYDIDFVMIDNLQRYVKDDKFATQNTSRAMSMLKDSAVDLKIPILLITHITKPEKNRNNNKVTMHDAKQSSTIYQVADIYLTVWNDKDPYSKKLEDKMFLSVEKNRMGEGNLDFPMSFDKSTGIYSERIEEDSSNKKKVLKKNELSAKEMKEDEDEE